mmetsp:Transcript_26757/g.76763  ORF Transcript_26757/g.76763 Transcript_26757/m.76763 type:complete len:351 (-) Transcript_26757:58-1110(-)
MICTDRLPRLLALALPVLARLARAEVCPAGSPTSGCAAAAAAASEAVGAAVELVQVAASPRRVGPARLLATEAFRDVPVRQLNSSVELSVEEAFHGVWACQQSWYTGGKFVTMTGTDVKIHTQCEGMKAHLEGREVHITEPELARGTICNITDGMMLCSNGDNCTKYDFPMEKTKASVDRAKYLGRWQPLDGVEEDAFTVREFETGEFYFEGKDNITGFFHLDDEGFWQGDLCQNKILIGGAIRFKLSKSKRMLQVSYYLPQTGWMDWQPTVMHKHPEEKSFPFLVVAIPLIALIFGVPASCFFFNMEGKPHGHGHHEEDEEEKKFKAQDLSVGMARDAPLEAAEDRQRR